MWLSAALLLDLSAAFDIVDHEILLKKLRSYKFSEDPVRWFESYLNSLIQGEHGVSHGSVFGPIIFIIFNVEKGSQPLHRRGPGQSHSLCREHGESF